VPNLRLAEALLHLATEAGKVQPSGVEIDITNKQLSSLSDISRLSRGSQNTPLFSSVEFILSSLRQRNDSF
jgi:hypothetical protein